MLITEKKRSILLKRANISFIMETNLQNLKQLKQTKSTFSPFHILFLLQSLQYVLKVFDRLLS